VVKTFFFGFGDQARRVKIDSSNRIVVAGLVHSANSSCGSYTIDFGVVRYTQDGSLDGTFIGGKQNVDVYGGDDHLSGLALQADGKIILFGSAYSSDISLYHFGVVRLNGDGSRDTSFGLLGNGIVTTALYSLRSGGSALALDPVGRIVAAGAGYGASTTTADVVVARYWP
jgi:uncharacterized delta-60 repeat protein